MDRIVELLNAKKPITEAHLDEIFPRGKAGPGCVLVVRDEHGRIVASERVEKKDEEHVQAFLEWLKSLGLNLRTFYIDHCQTYRKVIPQVFEDIRIQLDYFHIIQNVWKHLWKYMVSFRKTAKKRANESGTPWYKRKLLKLAKSLWKNRHLLFKSDKNLSDEERVTLAELCEADVKVAGIRSFLSGVWHIFEDSKDADEARKALKDLKSQTYAEESENHRRAIKFLDESLEQATTYLRHDDVKRNSLAETGMRTLRRLEREHDGFRTEDTREDFLRIYQAIKYLGWSVHHRGGA
jgi:transposase